MIWNVRALGALFFVCWVGSFCSAAAQESPWPAAQFTVRLGEPIEVPFSSLSDGRQVVGVSGGVLGLGLVEQRYAGVPLRVGSFLAEARLTDGESFEAEFSVLPARSEREAYQLTEFKSEAPVAPPGFTTGVLYWEQAGFVYEVGSLKGEPVLRGGEALTRTNGAYFVRYDLALQVLNVWSFEIGELESLVAARVDSDGDLVVLTGTRLNPFAFGQGGRDLIVRKFSQAGVLRWQRSSSAGVSTPCDLELDEQGHVYIAASYSDRIQRFLLPDKRESVQIGGHSLSGSGGFIAKFSGTGDALWVRAMEGGQAHRLAFLRDGEKVSLAVAGTFSGTANLGPIAFGGEARLTGPKAGVFVGLCNLDGRFFWARAGGSNAASTIDFLEAGSGARLLFGFRSEASSPVAWDDQLLALDLETYETTGALICLNSGGQMLWADTNWRERGSFGTLAASNPAEGSWYTVTRLVSDMQFPEGVVEAGDASSMAISKYDVDGQRLWTSLASIDLGASGWDWLVWGVLSLDAKGDQSLTFRGYYDPASPIRFGDDLVEPSEELEGVRLFRATLARSERTELVPIAIADSTRVRPGESGSIDVLANDRHPGGRSLMIRSVDCECSFGVVEVRDDQVLYTARENVQGVDVVEVRIVDDLGKSAVGSLTVVVGLTQTESGWSRELVSGLGQHIDLELDGQDRLSAVFASELGVHYLVRESGRWREERIPGTEGRAMKAELELDRGGQPHVLYYDAVDFALRHATRTGAGEWSVELALEARNIHAATGVAFRLGLGPDDQPHAFIAYEQGTWELIREAESWRLSRVRSSLLREFGFVVDADDVRHGVMGTEDYIIYTFTKADEWNITRETLAEQGLVPNSYSIFEFEGFSNPTRASGAFDLAKDPSGGVQLAYTWDGALKLAAIRDGAYRSATPLETVAETVRLAVDEMGRRHLLMLNADNRLIEYASEGETAWAVRVLAAGEGIGAFADLGVTSEGRPHVLYFDAKQGGLIHAVQLANQPPVAKPDMATTFRDEPVVISVLENDFELDDDALGVSIGSDPRQGEVDIRDDGSVTYRPLGGFAGEDSFTYQISDGRGGVSEAEVRIEVLSNSAFDADGDGVHDLWQQLFGITTGNLGEDPDADGYSSLLEYEWGTNPFDGFDSPAVLIFPSEEGMVLEFSTVFGKRYGILVSSDLEQWDRIGDDVFGSGESYQVMIEELELGTQFFRVSVLQDPDTDEDSLSDWIEFQVTGTDPNVADSDRDGRSDRLELAHAEDPLSDVEPRVLASLDEEIDPVVLFVADPERPFLVEKHFDVLKKATVRGRVTRGNAQLKSLVSEEVSTFQDMWVDEKGVLQFFVHPLAFGSEIEVEVRLLSGTPLVRYVLIVPPFTPKPTIQASQAEFGTRLSLGHSMEGAALYYTTDGVHPSAEDSTYQAGQEIQLYWGQEIRVVAVVDGVSSEVVSYRANPNALPTLSVSDELLALLPEDGSPRTLGSNAFLRLGGQTGLAGDPYSLRWQIFDSFGAVRSPESRGPDGAYAPLTGIRSIEAGRDHVVALAESGEVWAWGYDFMSDALNPTGRYRRPNRVIEISSSGEIALSEVRKLYAGYRYSVALKEDGTVWVWSGGIEGRASESEAAIFGTEGEFSVLGFRRDADQAAQVDGLADIVEIFPGDGFVLALDAAGRLWSWGINGDGVLGDGTAADRIVPQEIAGLPPIQTVAISRGINDEDKFAGGHDYEVFSQTVAAVAVDGSVWTWGANEVGQRGVGDESLELGPRQLDGLSRIETVAAGQRFFLVIDVFGRVYSWGANDWGQLGRAIESPSLGVGRVPIGERIIAVSGGVGHAVALSEDGLVLAWGANDHSQLGRPAGASSPLPERVQSQRRFKRIGSGLHHTAGVDTEGNVWLWGAIKARTGTNQVSDLEVSQPTLVFDNLGGAERDSEPGYVDENGNDVDDRWEQRYFSQLLEEEALAGDLDRDGESNLAEYVAGTHPGRASSRTASDDLVTAPADVLAAVRQDGSLGITVPIEVVPGVNGQQPTLAFSYSSEGRIGAMGVGWTIEGLSLISRGPTDLASDGFVDGIDFDENDVFFLDGARLVPVWGRNGEDGTEYRTRNDKFLKVVSYGQLGRGPRGFRVWTRDGMIHTFEAIEWESFARLGLEPIRGSLSFPCVRVEDRSGNWIDYRYQTQNGGFFGNHVTRLYGARDYNIAEIRYGGSGANKPVGRVVFEYTFHSENDPYSFIAGERIGFSQRLNRVVSFGSQLYRDYEIQYGVSPTGRNRVASIQPSGTDGGRMPLISFDYRMTDPNTPAWKESDLDLSEPLSDADGLDQGFAVLDLGVSASPILVRSLERANGQVEDTAWAPPFRTAMESEGQIQSLGVRYVDLNGDTYLDAILSYAGTDGVRRDAALFDPQASTRGWRLAPEYRPPVDLLRLGTRFGEAVRLIDVNGDGLLDVIGAYADRDGTLDRFAFVNGGPGTGWVEAPSFMPPADFVVEGQLYAATRLIDVNMDRLPDVVQSRRVAGELEGRVWLNTGNGWEESSDGRLLAPVPLDFPVIGVDVNGDTLVDLLSLPTGGGFDENAPPLGAFINTGGRGWVDSDFNYGGPSGPAAVIDSMLYIDISGDGLPDQVLSYDRGDESPLELVALSDGRSWESALLTHDEIFGLPVPLNTPGVMLLDMNGDGAVDITKRSAEESTTWLNQYAGADLLSGYRVESGAAQRFHYRRLNDGLLTLNAEFDPGVVEISSARFVVERRIKDDPHPDGQREHQTTYAYHGLAIDRESRELLGFQWIEERDAVTGLVKRTEYVRDPELVGLVSRESTYRNSGSLIHETVNEWEIERSGPFSEFGVYSTQLKETIGIKYEPDEAGVLRETLRTSTSFDYDDFGNVLRADETFLDGSSVVNLNRYFNDEERWILGRLYRSETQFLGPDRSSDSMRVATFDYDPATGYLIRETSEPGTDLELQVEYQRDRYGNIVQRMQRGSSIPTATEKTQFDPEGRFPIVKENALGQRTYLLTDPVSFQPHVSVGLNGETTVYEYDGVGRTKRIARPGGIVESYDFFRVGDGVGPLNASYLEVRRVTGRSETKIFYDFLGRHVRTAKTNSTGRVIVVDREYHPSGLLARESLPYFEGDPAYWTEREYDEQGRLFTVRDETDGRTSSSTYQSLNPATTGFVRVETERTPKSVLQRYFDGRGRVVRSRLQPSDGEGASMEVAYDYDPQGNLIQTEGAGVVTTQSFDQRGNRTAVSSLDIGRQQMRSDALGRSIWIRDAADQVTTRRYDALGRIMEEVSADKTTRFEYDQGPYAVGRVSAVSTSNGHRESYVYDPTGLLIQRVVEIDENRYVFDMVYDQTRRLVEYRYPTGLQLRYQYDDLGRLTHVSDLETGHIYWEVNGRDAVGRLQVFGLGDGTVTRVERDPHRGLLTSIHTDAAGGNRLRSVRYAYDVGDDLVSAIDEMANTTETMRYDGLSRLTEWRRESGVGEARSLLQSTEWSFDTSGHVSRLRRTSADGIAELEFAYAQGSQRLQSETELSDGTTRSFVYDENGNRVLGDGYLLGYAANNKPTLIAEDSGVVETFAYGVGERLVERTLDSLERSERVSFVSSDFEIIDREIDGVFTRRWRHYIRGGEKFVAVVDQDASGDGEALVRYLHRDQLGSVVLVTDVEGIPLQRASYTPYGQRVLSPNALAEAQDLDRAFTDHREVALGDFIHMGGRVFDPVRSVFLTPDIVVQDLFHPKSHLRYAYALNQPFTFTDPTGYFVENLARSLNQSYENLLFSVGYYAAYSFTGAQYDQLKTASKRHLKFAGLHYVNFARPVVSIGAGVGITIATAGIGSGVGGAIAAGALGGGITAGFSSVLYGGNTAENLDSSLRGAAQGAAFGYVGATLPPGAGKVVAHGLIGGAFNEINETGSFKNGFVTASVTKALSPVYDYIPGTTVPAVLARVSLAYAVGGATSELTGGSFRNGGMTAAYSRLFNTELTEKLARLSARSEKQIFRALNPNEDFDKGSSRGETLVKGLIGEGWVLIASAPALVLEAADLAVESYNRVKDYVWPSHPLQAVDSHGIATDAVYGRISDEVRNDYESLED